MAFEFIHRPLVLRVKFYGNHLGKGRVAMGLAEPKLKRGKGPVVLIGGARNDWMAGFGALKQDPSRVLASAGPPSRLDDQLKGPLTGAKIRKIQGLIHIQDGDQGDTRKIMALG